jgi:hypothetical protein
MQTGYKKAHRVSNGGKDAAITGTLRSVPLRRSGSHLGCQSLRLPAACSPRFGYSVRLLPCRRWPQLQT